MTACGVASQDLRSSCFIPTTRPSYAKRQSFASGTLRIDWSFGPPVLRDLASKSVRAPSFTAMTRALHLHGFYLGSCGFGHSSGSQAAVASCAKSSFDGEDTIVYCADG